jgi:ABC-type sugar transport system permease subunit
MAVRIVLLCLLDAFALWFLYRLMIDGVWFLFAVVAVISGGLNVVFLRRQAYPLRWLSPGLTLMIFMVVYPLAYNVYTAFTNYSDSHLLTKPQAIGFLESQQYLPEGAAVYNWAAFRSQSGEFALCLKPDEGAPLIALPGEPSQEIVSDGAGAGPLAEDGCPLALEGYERLSRADSVRFLTELSALEFGVVPNVVRILSLGRAGQYQERYVYDDVQDAMIDHATGTIYYAGEGTFTSREGEALRPGFHVIVGWRNFQRLLTSPALQGPLVRVFLWTVAFAFLAVSTTFALGLFLSVIFNDPSMPGRKLFRSILLIPYAVPYFISILIWRGMLNPHTGVINRILGSLVDWSPPWLSDQWWARAAIVFLVNLWLGFPYMQLITTGALQAIPSEIHEAAEVDGASGWQRFWHITLPLLLVTVGPLLVFSFAFNFNNFNVIYLFNEGGPPMANTATPVGHTDILITYSYRLAFEGTRGGDYGYAASITIIIFIVLTVITLFQFRYSRIWEEISRSV